MAEMGYRFEVRLQEVQEDFPGHLKREEVALYLSKLKANAFDGKLAVDELLITADTIVCLGDRILNKPFDKQEAYEMLSSLSGHTHQVITGVCLKTTQRVVNFFDSTSVTFGNLTESEIFHYLDNYKPYDKAGAYGIQEWIGLVGITGIEGSYFNVVGLPTEKLYAELKKFELS